MHHEMVVWQYSSKLYAYIFPIATKQYQALPEGFLTYTPKQPTNYTNNATNNTSTQLTFPDKNVINSLREV